METNAGTSSYDPADALADVRSSREAAAARVVSPWWYHTALGLNLAALVLVVGIPVEWITLIVVSLLSAVVSGMLANIYRRITGVWVSPKECGPGSRGVWAGIAAVIVTCLGVAFLVRVLDLPLAVTVVAAVVAAVAIVVLGRLFDVRLREEIRTGRATPEPRNA